jgi:hypothetical protein
MVLTDTGPVEKPVIKFGYDGDWVIRAQPGKADRARNDPARYTDSSFAGKFVPSPIDCRPWIDAQTAGWDLFFSIDLTFIVSDVERGLFGCPKEMKGRVESFAPFHLGVYTGVHIKTAPGWVTLVERVADAKVRDALPFTTESAILETDWYYWFKNFIVIRPDLTRVKELDVINIARGTPMCRVRVLPRHDLVQSTEFDEADYAELKRASEEYAREELAMRDDHRYRNSGESSYYPLYKLRAAAHRARKP